MNSITKSFIVASAILLIVAFVPVNESQAAIFDGSVTDGDVRFGICLESGADTKYPDECGGVDCDNPNGADEIAKCTSEAAAGTGLARTSLEGSGITHTENFGDFIKKLVNFALPYLVLSAFVGYVVAGFMYVTAFGNDEQLQKAKKILIWVSVGLILVMLSYAITNLLTGELVRGLSGSEPSISTIPTEALINPEF